MFCFYCFLLACHLSSLLCNETSLVPNNLQGMEMAAHGWWLLEMPDNDRSSADLVFLYTFTFIHVTGHSLQQLILRKGKDEAAQVCQKSVLHLLERQRKLRVPLWEAGPKHLHLFLLLFPCPAVRAMEGLEGFSSLPWHTLSTMVACPVCILSLHIFLFDCQAGGFIKYMIPKADCHFYSLWGVTQPTQFLHCRKYSSKTLYLADGIADLSTIILSKKFVLSSQSSYPCRTGLTKNYSLHHQLRAWCKVQQPQLFKRYYHSK